MRNILDRNCTENQNTFQVQYLFSENLPVYEFMSKNMVDPERTQLIIPYGTWALHAG
jgi:hypothetical protein